MLCYLYHPALNRSFLIRLTIYIFKPLHDCLMVLFLHLPKIWENTDTFRLVDIRYVKHITELLFSCIVKQCYTFCSLINPAVHPGIPHLNGSYRCRIRSLCINKKLILEPVPIKSCRSFQIFRPGIRILRNTFGYATCHICNFIIFICHLYLLLFLWKVHIVFILKTIFLIPFGICIRIWCDSCWC